MISIRDFETISITCAKQAIDENFENSKIQIPNQLIPHSEFQDLLQTVVSAVPSKSTLPILSNVLIEAAD